MLYVARLNHIGRRDPSTGLAISEHRSDLWFYSSSVLSHGQFDKLIEAHVRRAPSGLSILDLKGGLRRILKVDKIYYLGDATDLSHRLTGHTTIEVPNGVVIPGDIRACMGSSGNDERRELTYRVVSYNPNDVRQTTAVVEYTRDRPLTYHLLRALSRLRV